MDQVQQTIQAMRRLTLKAANDPRTRLIARKLSRGRGLVRNLWDLVGKIEYEKDPKGVEFVRDPRYYLRQLGQLTGDCDDQACVAATLLLAGGYGGSLSGKGSGKRVEFVTVSTRPGGQEHHVYLEADGVPFDPIMAGPIFGKEEQPPVKWPGWYVGDEQRVTKIRRWPV